jgi:hypothetical protein
MQSVSKITDESKAKLSVILTGILKITEAKNELMKVALESMKDDRTMTDSEMVTAINHAMALMDAGAVEVTIFRNMIRDDRSKWVKRQKLRDWRDAPREDRDPVLTLGAIIESMKKKAAS